MDERDKKDISDVIESQQWLTPLAVGLQSGILAIYSAAGPLGSRVKNFWHGTWFGHPLHPALTDIPLGAWTVAAIFDGLDGLRGRDDLASAAQTAVGFGLLGAIGAAKSGITDWASSGEQAPRAGMAHGLLNMAATCFYLASWQARRHGDRQRGSRLGAAGYVLLIAAAYLGGNLVYSQRMGVDHAEREGMAGEWTPVLPEAELKDDTLQRATLGDLKILLVRREGRLCAIGEVCSHLGGPLAEGTLEGCTVTCPWHNSRFDLASGRVIDGPATFNQPLYETRVRNGQIEVRAAHGTPYEV